MYVVVYVIVGSASLSEQVCTAIRDDFNDALMFARRCHDSGYHVISINKIAY